MRKPPSGIQGKNRVFEHPCGMPIKEKRMKAMIENAQVEICFSGCMMTLVASGQTVMVNSNDSVVIDSGVMRVITGD